VTESLTRPGYNPARLLRLIRESIDRCELDLRSSVVLTEAAVGAYAVTPVLAALAGARHVFALTRPGKHGTVEEVTRQTRALAKLAGVEGRIDIRTDRSPEVIGQADIVTNSGHVRPIDREFVAHLRPSAVIPLMYESWEFRPGDIDVGACREKRIPVAGTNERHPCVDVFSYLGIMAVKLLLDAGVAVQGSRILLLCDNPFAEFIERGLQGAGAIVECRPQLTPLDDATAWDAVLVALRPAQPHKLGRLEADLLGARRDGAIVAQYFGDMEREHFATMGVPVWPLEAPAPGHMGILPSAVGPEPVVRLQCGGLKVGELLWRARQAGVSPDQAVESAVDAGFADVLVIDDRCGARG
jgi:hypothetical protein